MTIWTLEDGWRDESSEGPYTETLQTMGGWSISRLHEYYRKGGDKLYKLEFKNKLVKSFKTIEAAKAYVIQQAKEPLKPCRSPYCECDIGKCTHPGFYDARG